MDMEKLKAEADKIKMPTGMQERIISNCSKAIEEEQMKQTEKGKVLIMKRVSFRKAAAFAVCLAVIGSIGALPVMAEHIPAVRNALSYFSGKDSYMKDPVIKNDAVSELAETVDVVSTDNENNISLNIQNVYYDGDDVLIYYVFEAHDDKFKDYTSISTENFALYADGKEVIFPEKYFYESIRMISGGKCDDGVFAGMFSFTGDVLPDKDKLDMELKIKSVEMLDTTKVYFNYNINDPCYDYGERDKYNTDISCRFEMNKQEKLQKTYQINQEKEGIKVNSVKITPLKASFDITAERDGLGISLTDDMGNEIAFLNKDEFDTPLKSAKTLTLKFTDLYKDDMPEICSFTFDIDGGYRNENTYYTQEYKSMDVTYIPPQEEAEKWIEENRTVMSYTDIPNRTPFNEWRDYKYDYYTNPNHIKAEGFNYAADYSVKISGVEYVTDLNELDLESCALSPYAHPYYKEFINDDGTLRGYTLVILEMNMRNNEDVPRINGISGCLAQKDDIRKALYGEFFYLDKSDNEGQKKFQLDFEANEEKTYKLGFMVNNEAVEHGLVFIENHGLYYS